MTGLVKSLKSHTSGHGAISYDSDDAIAALFQMFCNNDAKAGGN